MKERRKEIYTGVLICLVIMVVALSGYLVYDKMFREPDVGADVLATRTMLAEKTSYTGSWITENEGLFEVYLPGALDTTKEWDSLAVSTEYDVDYDNAVKRAFGVVYSDTKMDIEKVSDDPMAVLDAVADKITADIAAASRGGRPSIAYDVEVVTLKNDVEAVKISGDMDITLIMQKSKDDTETYQDTMTYPVLAYVTLQKGYPVGVWTTYDPFDYFTSEECPTQLEEMATTIWQTKFTGEDEEWVEVPTTLDENRRIIFPEDTNTEDSSEENQDRDPNEPDVGSPSWVGTPNASVPPEAHIHEGEVLPAEGEVVPAEGDAAE